MLIYMQYIYETDMFKKNFKMYNYDAFNLKRNIKV